MPAGLVYCPSLQLDLRYWLEDYRAYWLKFTQIQAIINRFAAIEML